MPPKRMTANPVKPARYRPGKPVGPESSSDDDDDEVDETVAESTTAAPPKATSFPSESNRIAANLRHVDLNERRQQAARDEAARKETEAERRRLEEEGFVTEESSGSGGGSEEEEDSSSEEEEESSEEEQPRPTLLRPTFIKKDKRQAGTAAAEAEADERQRAKEEEDRKKAADEIVEDQLRREAAIRAAGKRDWDDDEAGEIDQVDDTDGRDPEAERAAWRLRELRRVKREREAIEQAEKEREEVERRRNLSKEERDEEDEKFLAQQRSEKDSRGQMSYMQKYFHKGAFFQDDAKEKGLDRRDIMGSRFQDDVSNRELLPQYMQIRDMTRLGRKGRTKYKDLQSEDTGRWGEFNDRTSSARGRDGPYSRDERFQPDFRSGGSGATGANASVIRDRRHGGRSPVGPRGQESPTSAADDRHDQGRERSPDGQRRREVSSPRGHRGEESPRRSDRHDDRRNPDRDRRKRSPVSFDDRSSHEKRRKVDVG